MRAVLVILILVSLAGTATAQRTRSPPPKQPDGKNTSDALSSCIAMWDRGTHMSRQDWRRACRRVADRIQNLTVK